MNVEYVLLITILILSLINLFMIWAIGSIVHDIKEKKQ